MKPRFGFVEVAIRDVCEAIIDCVNKTAPVVAHVTPYKMLRTSNVRHGWINLDDVKFVTADVFERWNRRATPRNGDVILTREAPLGEVGMLRQSENVFLGQRLILYRADPAKLDNRFLLYALQTELLRNQIMSYGSGATVEHMRVPDCQKLLLRLPPLPCQRRIGDILSAYDDLIENNTRRIKILEEMAQRLYREWFVDFRFPGHEKARMVDSELGPIPEGWSVQSLGSLTSVVTKGTTPTTLGREFRENGVNFIKVESLTELGAIIVNKLAKIDVETHELLKRSQLLEADILFSIAGAIGRVAMVPRSVIPANTNQALAIIRSSNSKFVSYLFLTVRSPHFQNFSLGRVVQTAQANVSLSILKSAPILVPAEPLLTSFQEAVAPILAQASVLSTKIETLRATRDLLLPKLISGEIPVEAADDAAAELMEEIAQPA